MTERTETVSKNKYNDIKKRFYQSNKERFEFEAKYDALLAENEILKSKASQFESTIAETMRMRDAYLAQAESLAKSVEFYASKYPNDNLAEVHLEYWQKFKEQR